MTDKVNKGIIFISNVQKALEHEWFVDSIDPSEFQLEFVLFNSANSELFQYITKKGIRCSNYSLKSKYMVPFYIGFFFFKFLFKRYNFIHCHLFEASLIGLVSAKWSGIKKRIHTRHHSDFHHTYFPKAVKWDILINYFSTHIIAVSKNVAEILIEREQVQASKVSVIPHGIPLELMKNEATDERIDAMKQKYHLQYSSPIIGVVSRLTFWKGIQFIIPAFNELLSQYPHAKLVIANAKGDYSAEINKLLKQLPDNSYQLIEFENNMPLLFKAFDVFAHTPIDKYAEAFGQVYLEAFCYGTPMVCTMSGVANDLIIHQHNALVVPYKNSTEIAQAMKAILSDDELKARLMKNGREDVQQFTFEKKYCKIRVIYLS